MKAIIYIQSSKHYWQWRGPSPYAMKYGWNIDIVDKQSSYGKLKLGLASSGTDS